ncbi:MAG: hypothetical protein WCG91_04220 [Candidatus Shapirobacteria bacterium]
MKKQKSTANILWAAGPNSKFQLKGAKAAGFLAGLWHGIIAPVTFIISLFTPKVKFYESNNNGKFYDFGFILGICVFGVGSNK